MFLRNNGSVFSEIHHTKGGWPQMIYNYPYDVTLCPPSIALVLMPPKHCSSTMSSLMASKAVLDIVLSSIRFSWVAQNSPVLYGGFTVSG